MNFFKKKKKLEIGQIWSDKPLTPFGEVWWAKILDIKDGFVKIETWVEKMKDVFSYRVPRVYKENEFRRIYPTLIK